MMVYSVCVMRLPVRAMLLHTMYYDNCVGHKEPFINTTENFVHLLCIQRCMHMYFTFGATANNFSNNEHYKQRTKASS